MRNVLARLPVPDHLGLAYEVSAPVETSGRNQGKVADARRSEWLESVVKGPGTPVEAHPFRAASRRWSEAVKSMGCTWRVMELLSPLLLGHGLPSVTEVGLTLHRTYGVPFVPGSSLKGLLSHYLDAVYGPIDPSPHPLDAGHPEPQRAPYQALRRLPKGVVRAAGRIQQTVFGGPDTESDLDDVEDSAGARGCVEFFDALPVLPPRRANPLVQRDVLTPHHSAYYRSAGESGGANDHDDPVPVGFLSVPAGARFRVVLGGPTNWAEWAMDRLVEALGEWGVGGKTSCGYGRMKDVTLPARSG